MNIIDPHNQTIEVDINLDDTLKAQKQAFLEELQNNEGIAFKTRIDRLQRCLDMIQSHRPRFIEAVDEDFSGRSRHATLMTDLFTSVSALRFSMKHLKRWMRPRKRKVPQPMGLFGAKAQVIYQPKGVVGLMTPWNVPVNMVFTPLADILAAGNRCMIKPSEFTEATSELFAELFPRYFDITEVAVFTGGPELGAKFGQLPFDHLMFTGSSHIAKLIMQNAAQNLTPVTLELGGKSPVIVGESAKIGEVAARVMAGKCMNSGQLCVSPDYILLPQARVEAFILRARQCVQKWFPTLSTNPDYTAIINQRHVKRLQNYLADAQEQGARLVELNPAEENCLKTGKIAPTLVVDPPDNTIIMQEEIFGPLLVIRSYTNLNEAIDFVNARPRPLAFYYFGKDKKEQQKVIHSTIAGGVTINDVAMHVGCDDLPFGGIGNSGIGHYHGEDGFKTFSHAKAIYRQGFINLADLAGTLPPYGEKVESMMNKQIGSR